MWCETEICAEAGRLAEMTKREISVLKQWYKKLHGGSGRESLECLNMELKPQHWSLQEINSDQHLLIDSPQQLYKF